jgi:trehalose 6-phosphate synthase
MNLVAKEYVAAQNPLDPGILVLSRFAGAARQLDAAVLVNPNDIDAIARGISSALAMSAEERRERWRAMMQTLQSSSLNGWFSGFVGALTACRQPRRLIAARTDAALLPFRPRRGEAAPSVSQGA